MTQQRRSFTSLPPYLQTNRNNLELAVTDDLLYEPEQAKFISGFVGDTSKLSEQDLARTPKLVVNSPVQQKYQFSIGVAQLDPTTQNYVSGCFYDDLLNHLSLNGGLVNDQNRLFGSYYYAWSPPINYDKIVNPARYVWTGEFFDDGFGEYITKESAGSQIKLHKFDGTTLNAVDVTIIDGVFPSSPATDDIVEDASTTDRLLYRYDGSAWVQMTFFVASDITDTGAYNNGDYVYVCRTGVDFNRPLIWVYTPAVGRWIAIPVVVNQEHPDKPIENMIWEDVSVTPQRVFRIYQEGTWKILDYEVLTGPSTTRQTTTYVYDIRPLSDVDSWSRENWWRAFDDLSTSDRANLPSNAQASRPIIELWASLEKATGDIRTERNQVPLFKLYAVSTDSFDIQPLTVSEFAHLDTGAITTSGNFVDDQVVSRIFRYVSQGNINPDPVLGFPLTYGSDGTPLFDLESESLVITQTDDGVTVPVKGYRYYKDTVTQYMHCIWERTGQRLEQSPDDDGLYPVPKNLKFNPDHIVTTSASRATYINHFTSVISAQEGFDPDTQTPYGSNNYRYSPQDLTVGASMIDPEETLLRMMTVLQTDILDIPDAIRQMARDYNKVMARFVSQMNNFWNDGTIASVVDELSVTAIEAVDLICTAIFAGRNSEFPYYYSQMGTYSQCRKVGDDVVPFDPNRAPIYIPVSSAQIGASPPFLPEKFIDIDGIEKIRGHDGSLIPSYGDGRDDVILELEKRFFDTVPTYLSTESIEFSGRFNSTFHLDDFYGNYVPNPLAGEVVQIVDNYNDVVSPVAQNRIFSRAQQVYAIWNGTQWLTRLASVGDVFLNQDDGLYYIFNGYYANEIPSWNNTDATFDYSFNEYRQVVQREFERWIVLHELDFITNDQFDQNDPFTWNYSSAGIEGNYRGIYRRIYRTVRPHSHPWEIVGYSIMPDWWLTAYDPTSTASDGTPRYANTHAMWDDLADGVINAMTSPVTILDRMAMIAPIPVDADGELLDPIAAGIVEEQSVVPSAIADDWAYGDGSPIEESFYNSYYYGFAVALAGYLMKPGLFVDRTWSEFNREIGNTGNLLWNGPHVVADATLTRPAQADVPSHLSLDANNEVVVNPGLNAWIAEYTQILGKSANLDFNGAIINTAAVLGWKTYTFVNAKRTRVELLNGDEVPTEDLSVVLHQGPSLNEYFHSGIIIVRDIDGFRVFGTDVLNPYFRTELGAQPVAGGQVELTEDFTYDGRNRTFVLTEFPIPLSNDTATFAVLINGYKVSSRFITVVDNTTFTIDPILIMAQGDKVVATVVTTMSNPGTQLGTFTVNGFQITYFRSGTGVYVNYPYGTLFETLNDVVNMMVGHGRFLAKEGWVFERLTNGVLRDWLGAAKAFALWATDLSIKTRGNPSLMQGKTFEYSVMGRQAQFSAPFGMVLGVEEIRNGAYGVVDSNSQPIRKDNLDVVSTGGNITVSSGDTELFGLRLYVSEVQHVVFFPNTTTFGDIIYEPALGLSQDAVFVDTYGITNWNGRMEAPGFLIGGDAGGDLLPNWEKQTNDITRYYDRFNPVDDPILLGMARNMFGYVPKDYMDLLGVDDRSKYNFFHGSLKTKGTFQPYKAFIRGTTIGSDNLSIIEDWAWRFARYGDKRNVTVLFSVDEADWVDTFQVIHFDEIGYSNLFLGDGSTSCFNVPRRFDPADLVVIENDYQLAPIDSYTATPTDTGYNICFNAFTPGNGQHIYMTLNREWVRPDHEVFYQAAGNFDTGVALRPNNVIAVSSGTLVYPVTVSNQTITLSNTTYFHVLGNVGDDIFVQTSYTGDGFTRVFDTTVGDLDLQNIIVVYNGIWLSQNYVLDHTNPQRTKLQLFFTPELGSQIVIIAVKDIWKAFTRCQEFTGNGSTRQFHFSGPFEITSYREVIVAVDGIFQIGPIPNQSVPNTYTIKDGGINFNTAPGVSNIIVFAIFDAVAASIDPIEDDRVIYVPQFSPPTTDSRWVVTPPQEIYRDKPYRFPMDATGNVDFNKYLFTAAIVDQSAQSPAVRLFNWNPAKNLHEPVALAAIDYKVPYDPARYNNGPLAESANGLVWSEQQVGTVWWDTTNAIYSDYEGFLPDYMRVSREWGRLKYYGATITRDADTVTVTTMDPKTGEPIAHGLVSDDTVTITGADQPEYDGVFTITVDTSTTFTFIVYKETDVIGTGDIRVLIGSIDCYEWVASPVPPTAWTEYLTQQTGFDVYTGTVLNVDNASYSTREVWDVNGNSTTTYYFWVQNNTRIIPSKDICVSDIAGRLENPALYEIPFLAIIDPATMFVFAGDTIVLDDYAVEVSYQWYELPRHVEWMLIGEIDNFSLIPNLVTDKLLDSMLGEDSKGNPVPNVTLAPADKLGTSFFPAQSVFPDPDAALGIYVDAVNNFLVNTDISTLSTVFGSLDTDDEKTSSQDGYWSRTTYWVPGIDHAVVYDVIVASDMDVEQAIEDASAELSFRTDQGLYAPGDIVQVTPTEEKDLWDNTNVSAYYQYDGSDWNVIGIVNHTVEINPTIMDDATRFRQFFANLTGEIDRLDSNTIIFSLLFEMLRQNPVCDWFFKTSYIDLQVSLPFSQANFIAPDQASLVLDAVLDLKPFRTKVRDFRVSYMAEQEDIVAQIDETQIERVSLIYDRVACDLSDENAWDTIPWDATVTYPEDVDIHVQFIGTGDQTCFIIPESVPPDNIYVTINGQLIIPVVDYTVNITPEVCFTTAPEYGVEIEVVLDSEFEYFADFTYEFRGDGVLDSETLPDTIAETTVHNVFSAWNGVHQRPFNDFLLITALNTFVQYTSVPSSEIDVTGIVFGGVTNDVFVTQRYTADGIQTQFDTSLSDQTEKTVIVHINGVWQIPFDSYTIDNTTFPGSSYVVFDDPPEDQAKIVLYSASYPNLMSTASYNFVGDGETVDFAIPGLFEATNPAIFVNLDGIQQSSEVNDYQIDTGGLVFTTAPANGVGINVFVVWTGLGTRLAANPSPATIQWDWAFWNYADLGRQEYDFAGLFIGDGVSDGFSVPIPQTSSSLYSVLLKFFENGVEKTSTQLGVTYTITKLATSVSVFLSDPLPTNVYVSLYLSRGFYEGLEPTFGYQDPSGIVFEPTPATYQHYFARLLTTEYDPSDDMVGCPTPEERIQTNIEDVFTIAIRTFTEVFNDNPIFHLIGQQVAAQVGSLAFTLQSSPNLELTGLRGISEVGTFAFAMDTAPTMTGLEAITAVGSITPAIPFTGLESTSETGSISVDIDSSLDTIGLEVTTEVGDFTGRPLEGVEAEAEYGDLIATTPAILTGVAATTEFGVLAKTGEFTLVGRQASTNIPTLPTRVSIGQFATSEVGILNVANITKNLTGQTTHAFVGILRADPKLVNLSGVEATTGIGTMTKVIA